jgi:ATP-dependent Clp protease protease subunit
MSEDDPIEEKLSAMALPLGAKQLYESRTILIMGEISSMVAERVTSQLLTLSAQSIEPIRVFIHSQGGHVEAGDTIHDMIKFVAPRVIMVGTGWVASAGTHIYLAVPREDRFALPNTRFMIHQPLGGVGGRACGPADRGGGDPEGARAPEQDDRRRDWAADRQGPEGY